MDPEALQLLPLLVVGKQHTPTDRNRLLGSGDGGVRDGGRYHISAFLPWGIHLIGLTGGGRHG